MSYLNESRVVVRGLIERKVPFVFTKWGDAEIEWIYGIGGGAAEREVRTPAKAALLTAAWLEFAKMPGLWLGDWRSASNPQVQYPDEYERMLDHCVDVRYLHYETFLSMVLSIELRELFEAIRADPRKKMLVAPEPLFPAADWLGCDMMQRAAWSDGCDYAIEAADRILALAGSIEVAYFCAGRASKIMMSRVATIRPEMTLVDLGSALDPAFIGRTRSQQVPHHVAKEFFGL